MTFSETVRCRSCAGNFVVDYTLDPDRRARNIKAECPFCREYMAVELANAAQMFVARRPSDEPAFAHR